HLNIPVSRRRLLAGAGGAAAALAVARLDAAAQAGGAMAGSARVLRQDIQPGGTLTYGLGFDLDGTMDPAVTNFDSTIRVTLNVCEPLVWMPNATDIVPALAESWSVYPDGLEWTFKLKQGVTFHDGTPFNAKAVQYTYDRVVALDKYTASAVAAGTPVDAVTPGDVTKFISPGQSHDQIGSYDHSEVIDDTTIKMVLSKPFAPFLTGLNGYLGIVSPTAVEKMGLAEFARKPVGTGPYKVKEWIEADHVTLEKNADYKWGSSFFKNQGAAYFDEIVFKIIPDDSVRTGTLISGETQYIDTVDPLQLQDVMDNPDLEVVKLGQPGSGWILLFNVARPGKPQMDMAVRQALSYAIDKDAMNKAVWGGINSPASSPLMKPTFGYEPKTETMYTYDKAKAESMLDAAGWVKKGDVREKDGAKLSMYWSVQDRPNDKAIATFVQGSFKAIGVEVIVEAMERGAARANRKAGKYDISFLWFSYADPDVLRTIFWSKNIGAFNFANYSNTDVDKWLEDAASNQDQEARKALYSKVQIKVLEDAVTIPMSDSLTYNAKSKKLTGDYLDFLASYVWLNDAKI
ncbi:MAG: ABC transporter substrate-binding protein, partial [Thermomicrobiales bacterium]